MPFTAVGGTDPIEYTWTTVGAAARAIARVAVCGGVATGGGGVPTRLTAKNWASAIDPRESAALAPVRPGGVDARARYNTLNRWVTRAQADSTAVFTELAEAVKVAESNLHGLATGTPAAPVAMMPGATTSAIAINSDMTGDLCWLIVAMRLCPGLAVAIRIGTTEKHLRFCTDMIGQLVSEGLAGRTIVLTGAPLGGGAPAWAARTKTTHWHPVCVARRSLPVAGANVESCLTTSRRVFEASERQALAEQRSIADVACELFGEALTRTLGGAARLAIDGAIHHLTTAGCLSTHAGYILLANRVEDYNYQHNTSNARFNAVNGARGARRLVTFGRPRGGGEHIDLHTNHAQTDAQRAYFWTTLKATMRGLGRDVVIVGGRSGSFDIAYHAGEEPTGGGLCWDIAAAAPARDPEVDRLQQQAGPGSLSGLTLAILAVGAEGPHGGGDAGDIAASMARLLDGGGAGIARSPTLAVGLATQVSGAESRAMRNAEAGRYLFQRATAGAMTSVALGGTLVLHEQVVSEIARQEANKTRLHRAWGRLAYPVADPKPIPRRSSFQCPACGNMQQSRARYEAHRRWERHY